MYVNLTPHDLTVRTPEGDVVIPASGEVARVGSTPGALVAHEGGIPIYGAPTWGAVEGLPEPEDGRVFVVSALVAARCPERGDVVSPGTGPADGAVRDGGRIVAVTRFVRAPTK